MEQVPGPGAQVVDGGGLRAPGPGRRQIQPGHHRGVGKQGVCPARACACWQVGSRVGGVGWLELLEWPRRGQGQGDRPPTCLIRVGRCGGKELLGREPLLSIGPRLEAARKDLAGLVELASRIRAPRVGGGCDAPNAIAGQWEAITQAADRTGRSVPGLAIECGTHPPQIAQVLVHRMGWFVGQRALHMGRRGGSRAACNW